MSVKPQCTSVGINGDVMARTKEELPYIMH